MFSGLLESIATSVAPQVRSEKGYEDFIVTNPPGRREIRPDFPRSFDRHLVGDMDSLAVIVRNELDKQNSSLGDVKSIYIAYPHKHPKMFPDHRIMNDEGIDALKNKLKSRLPQIDFCFADSIVETVHLARSDNQRSLHALTKKQVYEIYKESSFFTQESPNPFVFSKGDCSNPHFIIFDHGIEQGTTIANMMSFLEHNGGRVLATASKKSVDFVQIDTRSKHTEINLVGEFANPNRNTGRLPQLAAAFFSSAGGNYEEYATPQKCIEVFEGALNGIGHSVFALTDGECERLSDEFERDAVSFPHLITKLRSFKC